MRIRKVILITIDSLRADSSEPIVNTMQKLLGRISKKVIFSNGPGTPQAFPSILSSSSFLLLHNNFRVAQHMITLPEIISKHGFITIGIHSNPYLSRAFDWNRGFKIFLDYYEKVSSPLSKIMKLKLLRGIISSAMQNKYIYTKVIPKAKTIYQTLLSLRSVKPPYVDAVEITSQAIRNLSIYKDKNLFLWIHYMDTHWPYNVPEEQLAGECGFNTTKQALRFLYKTPISFISSDNSLRIDKNSLNKMKCLYKESIIYVNKHVRGLLLSLDELDILNESLIIITGDHGEAFLEHAVLGHPFYALYNENLQVPLVIWYPGIGKRHNILPVQHRELAPWIARIIGIERTPKVWLGKKSLAVKYIFAESAYVDPFSMTIHKDKYIISVINNNYKLMWDKIKNKIELYNIKIDPWRGEKYSRRKSRRSKAVAIRNK